MKESLILRLLRYDSVKEACFPDQGSTIAEPTTKVPAQVDATKFSKLENLGFWCRYLASLVTPRGPIQK